MKKIIPVLCAAVMALSLFAGCGQKANDNGTTAAGGTVATDGSTSMEKVIGALGESFMEANKGTTFTYNPTGSGSGIQAVSEGRCDIGLSSRALKDDEKAAGLKETIVALDGIAIIVNPQNPVKDLSLEQIAKIYTGEITNWKDVGGEDAEIVLIGREAGSGTRDGFESITETKDACQYRQELTSTGDVITGGDRQGRHVPRPASVRPRDEGGHCPERHRAEVLRLRDLCGCRVHHLRGGRSPGGLSHRQAYRRLETSRLSHIQRY